MTVNFNRDTAFSIIANEKMGFRWGLPQRPDVNSVAAVLPLLRESSLNRDYILLSEPEASKAVHIEDTGRINRMRFTNKGRALVFVRAGTLLKGSTQERVTVASSLLIPGSTVELEVRCVHASRGINALSKVQYGGVSPLSMDQRVYRGSFASSSQGDFWKSVTTSNFERDSVRAYYSGGGRSSSPENLAVEKRSSRERDLLWSDGHTSFDDAFGNVSSREERLGSSLIGNEFPRPSANDDLASNLDGFTSQFEDVLSKVARVDNQVGLALITDKGCETLELFDLEQSWTAFHADAVKRVGQEAVAQDTEQVFEYRQDRAVAAVQKVLMQGYEKRTIYEHRASNGDPSFAVIGLASEHYTGEIVELDGRVIHALLLRMKN